MLVTWYGYMEITLEGCLPCGQVGLGNSAGNGGVEEVVLATVEGVLELAPASVPSARQREGKKDGA